MPEPFAFEMELDDLPTERLRELIYEEVRSFKPSPMETATALHVQILSVLCRQVETSAKRMFSIHIN